MYKYYFKNHSFIILYISIQYFNSFYIFLYIDLYILKFILNNQKKVTLYLFIKFQNL